MFKKLMKHVANNPGLKILSVLFSIVLWLVVVNIADPDKTKSFSVQVDILNKDVIEEMGKVPDVVGETDIASFYITGPRSYVEDMDSDHFSVTADLSQIALKEDSDVYLVPIEITPKKNEKYITVYKRTVNLQVTLEELSEQKFVIKAEATGTPANGCAIGNVEVTPNLLKISGPESVVSRISKVSASINVDGIASDVSDSVIPVLYDKEGNEISPELLEMNQSVVTIRANILSTKNVSIKCGVTGTPAQGYEFTKVEPVPEKIQIKGEASVLNSIYSIVVDDINVEGAVGDVDATVDIAGYLPEGVSLVDETANKIILKALIEQKATRSVSLPVESISVDGLDSDYELSYNGSTVPVSIRALEDNMDGFNVQQLRAKLDVRGLEPGTHTVELEMSVDDDKFEIIGTTSVQITIRDKNAVEAPGQGTANGGAGTDTNGTGGAGSAQGNGGGTGSSPGGN